MNRYKESLRQYFSVQAKGCSQEAEADPRGNVRAVTYHGSWAYGDLERGCSCCSAIALLFFLLMLEPDELTAFLAADEKAVPGAGSAGGRIGPFFAAFLYLKIWGDSEYGWSQTCAIGRQQRGISLVDVEKCGKS